MQTFILIDLRRVTCYVNIVRSSESKHFSIKKHDKKIKKDIQPDYDIPWKRAIENYFPDFMAFFFPAIHDDIDWKKGHEFLENDLQKITKDAKLGTRFADKLVKVHKKGGELAWVLIHIEVQSNRETNFEERIYIYRHRIWEQHRLDVTSLVILCDNDRNYKPKRYTKRFWGTVLVFQFPVVKLLDLAKDWSGLEQNKNPFALVVMAQIKAKSEKDGQQRKYWKIHLITLLKKRGYQKDDIMEMFSFIDWILQLPANLEREFFQEIVEFDKEKTMNFMTRYETIRYQDGIVEGRQEGRQEGELAMLFGQLETKFGQITEETKQKINEADSETLLEWGKNVLTAQTLDAVFTLEN